MSLPRTDFNKVGVVPRLKQSGNYAFLRSKVSPVVQSMVQSMVHSPGFTLTQINLFVPNYTFLLLLSYCCMICEGRKQNNA